MKEKVRKKIYNNIDDSWEYVLRSAKKYKEEFKKTAKIGEPPHIDDILESIIIEDEIASEPKKADDAKKEASPGKKAKEPEIKLEEEAKKKKNN